MDFDLTEEQRAFQATARQFARERDDAACARLGRERDLPGRGAAQGGGARLRRHLCEGRRRRLGAVAARRRAHLRGAGAGLHLDRGLHLDPQHGGVDDRRLRQRRAAPAIPAEALHHGAFRELLPDRAGRRLGRRQPEDARACATATITCSTAPRRSSPAAASPTSMSAWCAPARPGRKGISCHRGREGHARALVRRAGEEARLEVAADRHGDVRELPRAGGQPHRRGRARASASPWPGSTAAGSTSAPARSAARSSASTAPSTT